MSQKKRSFEPKSLDEVLGEITQEKKLASGLQNIKLQSVWKDTMGPHIQHYTEKIELRGSTLYVRLRSSPLREELSYGKEKILAHMNNALGSKLVDKIKFY